MGSPATGSQAAFAGSSEAVPSGYAPGQDAASQQGEPQHQAQGQAGGSVSGCAEATANPQGYAAPQGYGIPQGSAAPQGYAGPQDNGGPKGVPQGKPTGQSGHDEPGHVCTCGKHESAPETQPGTPYGFQPGYGPQSGMMFGPQGPQTVMFQGAPGNVPPYAAMPSGPHPGVMAGPQPGYMPHAGMAAGPQPGMPYGFQPGYGPQSGIAPGPQGPQPAYGPQPGMAAGPAPQAEHDGCGEKKGASGGPAGFGGFPGFAGQAGFGAPAFAAMAGMPGFGAEDPQLLQNRYGQMLTMCNEIMQGKADPVKIASFLTANGTHFWKGAIVGALATFVLTNSSVKSALGDSFSAVFGGAKSAEPTA